MMEMRCKGEKSVARAPTKGHSSFPVGLQTGLYLVLHSSLYKSPGYLVLGRLRSELIVLLNAGHIQDNGIFLLRRLRPLAVVERMSVLAKPDKAVCWKSECHGTKQNAHESFVREDHARLAGLSLWAP